MISQYDEFHLRAALRVSMRARAESSPNPWVGCRIVAEEFQEGVFDGATAPPGGPHAEAVALAAAGDAARGSTVYVTLEPCPHHGRTPPCVDALISAGVRRVVVGILDPDSNVRGRGIARLREAGIEVTVGVCEKEVREVLAPYIKHRMTARPWVILKLAATFDGHIAAPDGDSRWITGEQARADGHRLRSVSDAIVVGAGTVRSDDPMLTVRHSPGRSPLRVVLGAIPPGASVEPAISMTGDLETVLDELGQRGVIQLLVEGGAQVAHDFHAAGLVDRYLLYFAPAFFGGDDAVPIFRGKGAATMELLWRGKLIGVEQFGEDLRVELAPNTDVSVSHAGSLEER